MMNLIKDKVMTKITYINGQKGNLLVQSTVIPEPIHFNERVRVIRENNKQLKNGNNAFKLK